MKQKILILFVIFLFTVVPLTAKKIDSLAAEKAGMIHLEQQQNTWFSQLNQGLLKQEVINFSIANVNPVIDETSGETLFYVLHLSPEGFIVVSGETLTQPVLAYSYNGGFSMTDGSGNILLQMLNQKISKQVSTIENRQWELLTDKDIEQWPPVGHSQYNKGWLSTDVITPALQQITSYWKSPDLLDAPDTLDISRELREKRQFDSAKVEKYYNSASFFPGLIDNIRKGWPVQLALQIENGNDMQYVFCDGYRKTISGAEFFHLKEGGEFGTWYALKSSGKFIKYAVMDIHPTADLHEPNMNRHDAFPIQESEFIGKNGIWDSSLNTKINATTGSDWYRFEAKEGEKITITFRGTWTKAVGEIALYHNDTLLKQQDIIAKGEDERFSYLVNTDGTYHLAIGNTGSERDSGDISKDDPEAAIAIIEQVYGISIGKCIGCGGDPVLMDVIISGPSSVMENSYGTFTAEAYFDDDTFVNVTSSCTWTENSSYASFASSPKGRLNTTSVSSNQTATVSVSYTFEGRTRTDSRNVTIKDYHLDYITITGDSTIPENSSKTYTVRAYYTDGSYVNPSSGVSWAENSSYASISGTSTGTLVASAVTGNQSLTITAIYGGQSDTHAVTIVDSKVLTSLVVYGPFGINENSMGVYSAVAYFSNGTSSTVTYSCSWYGYCPSGWVSGNYVYTNEVPYNMYGGYINATYSYNGVTRSDSQSFTIYNF
jgi:Spi protease inhibitor